MWQVFLPKLSGIGMSKKINKVLTRIAELILAFVSLYLVKIVVNCRQEAKDAIILMIMCIGMICYLEIMKYLQGIRKKVLLVCLWIGGTIFLVCEVCIVCGGKSTQSQELMNADYIMVLGAKMEENGISDTLKSRLDCAIIISKKVSVPIIVTGGNNKENNMQEAVAMRDYLLKNNVKNEIILEDKALDTRQNFIYTAKLIELDADLIIVSSEVHMFRAKLLAKHVGFQKIQTACAKTDMKMYLYFNLREVVALLRELLMLYL